MDRDPAYLLDMLNACKEIQALSTGLTEQGFRESKLHQYALVKLIEIVGEAARSISESTRNTHAGIPWIPMIDMRNHLVHRYFRIDLSRVWDVVQNHIPSLARQLKAIVPPESALKNPDPG